MVSIAEELEESEMLLAVTPPEYTHAFGISTIRELAGHGCPGIVVSFNEPYAILNKALVKEGVDTSMIYFIDCITAFASTMPQEVPNCAFVKNPGDLTGLGIAVAKALPFVSGAERSYMLVDSISTVLVYAPVDSVIKFTHMLINKLKINSICGLFISSTNNIDPVAASQITSFVRKRLDISPPEE
ncbi:MAG: DUF7504 family protein [Methanomicrobiales archaeon]